MTREKLTTGLQKAVKLEQVPPERFGVMLQRTILGALLAGLGIVGLVRFEMNHYLAVGLVVVGCTVWSGQVVTGALKALVGPFKAFKDASRGD